ncbi:MAG: site-2 protease family protein [Thermoplasmata archaeon]|nr:site-2 protease family protein [Thermoplasmata archaeon]
MIRGHDERIFVASDGNTVYGGRSRKGNRVGIRFTSDEIKSLSIAIGVLTLVFAFAFSGNGLIGGNFDLIRLVETLPFALIAVLSAFALHELAHKIAGNFFGFPAGFTYSKRGLYIAFFVGVILGWAFAAPGAVIIYGRPTRKENGIISLAGPLTNLLMGIIFLATGIILFLFSFEYFGRGVIFISLINFFIGCFNMVPIMPFDGSKIWKWSKVTYFLMLIFLLPPLIIYYFFL